MSKMLKFRGYVQTNVVGSRSEFEFEVDEEELPTDRPDRNAYLNKLGLDALFGSGAMEWDYEQVDD